jgi:hypothetical protein
MVNSNKVTEDKQRARREGKLARRCFRKSKVYVGDKEILVHSRDREHTLLASKNIGEPEMKLYDVYSYRGADEFAIAYQDKFMNYAELRRRRFWIEPCWSS